MTAKTALLDDHSPAATLARVEAAFAPAPLSGTLAALEQLRASGDTLLFEGAVDWSLFADSGAQSLPAPTRNWSRHAMMSPQASSRLSA